jgi:glycosyltransferase involved in cell wall biosynthesis
VLLERALDSLATQSLSESEYEVIVVDNASSDCTRDVVEKRMIRHPNFRCVYEPRRGLSHARNRGAAEAWASFVAYMDDDCVAEAGWLQALLAQFHADPSVACVGGRVHLEWEGGSRPDWIPDNVLPVYAFVDLGDKPEAMAHASGCNMAWNRQTLLQLGGFRPDLGRRGDVRLSGEESYIQQQARARGLRIRYAPDALVLHWVPKERQSRGYILRTCYMIGVSASIGDRTESHSSLASSCKRLGRILLRGGERLLRFVAAVFMERSWPPRGNALYWLHLSAISWGNIAQDIRYLASDVVACVTRADLKPHGVKP